MSTGISSSSCRRTSERGMNPGQAVCPTARGPHQEAGGISLPGSPSRTHPLCPAWIQTAGKHRYVSPNPAEVSPCWLPVTIWGQPQLSHMDTKGQGAGTPSHRPAWPQELGPPPALPMEQDRIHVKMGLARARLQQGPRAWPHPLSCCDLGHGTSSRWRNPHTHKPTRNRAGCSHSQLEIRAGAQRGWLPSHIPPELDRRLPCGAHGSSLKHLCGR